MSWQSSLASQAVLAAEDVRTAVRASRTASGAKAAAESAALAAQNSFETGNFTTEEEVSAAKTRASISHSHSIHAAVIEHEAFTAKRKAAMALTYDVKCWNVHRKREILKTCLAAVATYRESSQKAVCTWSTLLDGLHLPTSICDQEVKQKMDSSILLNDPEVSIDADIVTESSMLSLQSPKIYPEDHKALNVDKFKMLSPLNQGVVKDPSSKCTSPSLRGADIPLSEPSGHPSRNSDKSFNSPAVETTDGEADTMTASMQSLVDGLMSWGGRYDPQDDMSLPSGMAVSIALEESGVLSNRAVTTVSL